MPDACSFTCCVEVKAAFFFLLQSLGGWDILLFARRDYKVLYSPVVSILTLLSSEFSCGSAPGVSYGALWSCFELSTIEVGRREILFRFLEQQRGRTVVFRPVVALELDIQFDD